MDIHPDTAILAIRTTARMLIEARERAEAQEARVRGAARARGLDFDARIQYSEGSAHAYAVAASILAGACGVPRIEDLAGEDWRAPRDPLPPMLPTDDHGDKPRHFAPGDEIAAATVIQDRSNG